MKEERRDTWLDIVFPLVIVVLKISIHMLKVFYSSLLYLNTLSEAQGLSTGINSGHILPTIQAKDRGFLSGKAKLRGSSWDPEKGPRGDIEPRQNSEVNWPLSPHPYSIQLTTHR